MRFSRARLAVAALAAVSTAAIVASTAQASTVQASSGRPAATSYVLVSCAGHDQARPSSFILTCADGNQGYQHMHWRVWGATAYATATSYLNDCSPNCAQGKFYYFPALIVAWRPEPLPGHAGQRYYTRLGWIFESKACLPSPPKGKITCLPQTGTSQLADWK